MTLQQWSLFEYLLDSMDWDSRHQNFGLFEFFPDELTNVFHKSSETIGDWFRFLEDKKFVILHDNKRKLYRVKNPERYVFGKASKYELLERNITVEKLLDDMCFSKSDEEFTEVISEKIPKLTTPDIWSVAPKALSSFRDDLSIYAKQTLKTIDYYKEAYRNEGYSLLSPEDMEWIDRNQNFNVVQNYM